MGIIRPATPGFLVTLVATGLLAAVTFSVPYIKSIYFLKATINVGNTNGTFTFGTLGYCVQLSNGTTCSKPSVGYELDVNTLLGDNTFIKIPNVLVKWITYALVLHLVALILSAISAVFGLLAHVREMSMAYCSSFISGFAAAVTLVAFIFDIVLFYVTKSRVNSEAGGSSSLGLGVWLTLAAWLLLFFAGCFYTIGRCCISRRPAGWARGQNAPENTFAEQMRLDAVKAEADRKARQKQGEVGLPAFQDLDQLQPLARHTDEDYVEDGDKIVPLSDVQNTGVGAYGRQPSQTNRQYPGGYVPAAPGTRAVDYSNVSPATTTVYPPRSPAPQARRQGSGHTQGTSGYAPSTYSNSPGVAGVGATAAGAGGYLAAGGYGHTQQTSDNNQSYGHGQSASSYYQASQQPYSSNYAIPRTGTPYAAPQTQTFSPDTYNSTGYMHGAMPSTSSPPPAGAGNPYYGRSPPPAQQDRSYTLGGDGYGAAQDTAYYDPYAVNAASHYTTPSPAPLNTNAQHGHPVRSPTQLSQSPGMPEPHGHEPSYSDSPPMYDAATAQPAGMWSTKPGSR
ncbi:SUR7/PalI family-domain-containing protein [Fomitopsis serialis]|uniref:SUR7/PalI family-domain-containing protein n=1 Tax=Fomitopsis serialis TaxID=139415 RepID=UPI002008B8F3|nr:SUR7/PalI family-domain-containing protein [Neoantrodia serialis]KAH9937340.1 SUR7/PalI family-domain-containing protein [Neoantrodia serialis]